MIFDVILQVDSRCWIKSEIKFINWLTIIKYYHLLWFYFNRLVHRYFFATTYSHMILVYLYWLECSTWFRIRNSKMFWRKFVQNSDESVFLKCFSHVPKIISSNVTKSLAKRNNWGSSLSFLFCVNGVSFEFFRMELPGFPLE